MYSAQVSVVGARFVGKSSIISNILVLDFSDEYIASTHPIWKQKDIEVFDRRFTYTFWTL